jgi:hypothetical protein
VGRERGGRERGERRAAVKGTDRVTAGKVNPHIRSPTVNHLSIQC